MEGRVAALEALVRQGTSVGVLAYADDEPVGWCSIAPRQSCEALERYRGLPRIDDVPVCEPRATQSDRLHSFEIGLRIHTISAGVPGIPNSEMLRVA